MEPTAAVSGRDGTSLAEGAPSPAEREAALLASLPDADPEPLRAFAAAVAERDEQRAIDAVRSGWFDLIRGDRAGLRAAIDLLPAAWLRDSALLSMLAGFVYYSLPHRRVKGLRLLTHASRAAASQHRVHHVLDRALILTSGSVAHRLTGRPRLGIRSARTALDVLRRMSDEERAGTHALPRLYAQLGTTLYYADEIDAALSAFEEGLAEMPDDERQHGYTNLAMLAGIHALHGDLPQAESYLEAARDERWPIAVRSMYSGTFYRLAEAVAALERFDAATARSHLSAMVHDRATIEHWIPIAIVEAYVTLAEGRPGAALAGLDAFAESHRGEGRSLRSRRLLAPTRALLQLALGSPDAAHIILQRDGSPGPDRDIALARAELAIGRHGSALEHLRRHAGAPLRPRATAEYAAIEAAALLRFSDSPRVNGALEQLGAVLQRTHQRFALALLPAADYRRVVSALHDAGYICVADLPESSLIPDPHLHLLLSAREAAVLQVLAHTGSAAAIAAELVVSVNTVKTQLRSLYRKLGVATRDEAIAVALDRHLITATRPGPEGRYRG